MHRTKIYAIDITMQTEKQLVELPLPENAKEIIGIRVAADIYPKGVKAYYNVAVGNLTLSVPEKGDVFFSELVNAETNSSTWEDWLLSPSPLESKLWYCNTGVYPYKIHLVDTTFITAYYEDFVNKLGSEPKKYTVQVSIHYLD